MAKPAKDGPDYLKAKSAPLCEEFAAPANTRALEKVVGSESVCDADARECQEHEDDDRTEQRLLHPQHLSADTLAFWVFPSFVCFDGKQHVVIETMTSVIKMFAKIEVDFCGLG